MDQQSWNSVALLNLLTCLCSVIASVSISSHFCVQRQAPKMEQTQTVTVEAVPTTDQVSAEIQRQILVKHALSN